nr:hypothetical protein CFP56_20219 [Quercus suber]
MLLPVAISLLVPFRRIVQGNCAVHRKAKATDLGLINSERDTIVNANSDARITTQQRNRFRWEDLNPYSSLVAQAS